MSGFTKGKWKVEYDDFGDEHKIILPSLIRAESGRMVAAVGGHLFKYGDEYDDDDPGFEELYANANVIAAVPDLVHAVKELVYEQCQLTCKDHDRDCEPTCWVLKHKKLIDSITMDCSL